MVWKTSEKRMKQKYKTKWKATPVDYNKGKTELEDEMVIKGKTEELLVRQLKSCERNLQELTDSTKRPNL
jgi:hypothetical protein